MKILKGDFKGVEIVCPDNAGVRPTVDHLKKHILNIYNENPGGNVWDLFCGSGGVGLELLSGGASSCVFIDQLKIAISCLNLNVNQCLIKNKKAYEEKALKIINASIEIFLKAPEDFGVTVKPDFIFLDPPYGQNWMKKIFKLLAACPLVTPRTFILAEHVVDDPSPNEESLLLIKQEVYGPKILTVFKIKHDS